jgi:hypothetical protein
MALSSTLSIAALRDDPSGVPQKSSLERRARELLKTASQRAQGADSNVIGEFNFGDLPCFRALAHPPSEHRRKGTRRDHPCDRLPEGHKP